MSDKKDRIIDTAITLFANEGVGVATAKIAKEAGVSNGTLFNYFATKQILIDSVYLEIKREVAAGMLETSTEAKNAKELFWMFWTGYVSWGAKNTMRHSVLDLLKSSRHLSEEIESEVEKMFAPALAAVQDALQKHDLKDVTMEYLMEVTGAQMSAAINYAEQHKLNDKKLEEHIQNSFDVYWSGIKA